MNTLKARLNSTNKEVQRIREEIHTAIMNLPDNPKINRINKSCFTVSSKDVFGSPKSRLDVFYHDFPKQYEKIAELIDSCHSENIIDILEGIISNGYCKHFGQLYNFHPSVITNLKTILQN